MQKVEKLKGLADKSQLELILIFGSQAQGTVHPESDVDIAVYSKHILSEDEKINLTFEIGNMLHTEKIDLVDIKTASPLLKKKIFENYTVLYQKDPFLLYQLELTSLYEYKESEVLYEIRRERLQESIG
jgi:predicted nucleotidyltransferase